MSDTVATIAGIVAMAFTVAIVAVLVSKNANTTGVIQSGASGVSSIIAAAVAPVTGGQAQGMGGFPGGGNGLG